MASASSMHERYASRIPEDEQRDAEEAPDLDALLERLAALGQVSEGLQRGVKERLGDLRGGRSIHGPGSRAGTP